MNNNKIIGYDPMTGQPIYETQSSPVINEPTIVQQNITPQTTNLQTAVEQDKKKKNKPGNLIKVLIITNILTAVLSIIFIVAFILKDTDNKSEEMLEEESGYTSTVTTEPVSSDWTKYQFSIKGKTFTLPCLYKEFRDISGFNMKSSDEKSYLQANYSTYVNLYIGDENNQKLALYIDVKNDTNEDLRYSESQLVRISQTEYQVETNKADLITFPGDLKIGLEISKERIIELLGEPTKIIDDSDEPYGSITLTYNMDSYYTTVNYYQIILRDGKIDELTLDHKKSNE